MSLPTITVIGNLKRIETRFLPSGKQVTKFQVECAEKGKDDKWTNLYLSGECWEQKAKFLDQYFKEGSPAIVTGKLFTNVYEKQDGTKVYENKLLFPNISFVPKDKSDNQSQSTSEDYNNKRQQPEVQYQNNQGHQVNQQQYNQHQLPSVDESEIPF